MVRWSVKGSMIVAKLLIMVTSWRSSRHFLTLRVRDPSIK